MRKLAKIVPPANLTPTSSESRITEVREYSLITPLYGGGVEPFEYDPITVVRATEIRGLLRFWWRACRGGNTTGNLSTLKAREETLWGKAYKKGDLGIEIAKAITISVEGSKAAIRKEEDSLLSEYAAFPLRPTIEERRKNPELKPKPTFKNVSFKLTISFPQTLEADIRAALWAWETFGGVGARTRRGFGALQLQNIHGKPYMDLPVSGKESDVRDWLQTNLDKHVLSGLWPDNVPHLSQHPSLHITRTERSAMMAWKNLVDKLKAFRQAPFGRLRRSNWPEAETIRHLTGRRCDKYTFKNHPRKFPRAAFGLPIIFHFKDERIGDPYETTLQIANKQAGNKIEKRDRFASPLILKPLMCQKQDAVGIALLLEGTQLPAGEIRLKGIDKNTDKDEKKPPVDTQLLKDDLKRLPDLKLIIQPNDQKIDILQTFMNYLEKGNNY